MHKSWKILLEYCLIQNLLLQAMIWQCYKKRFNDGGYKNFIKYGFIKTIIYRPNLTISSAGDVEHFNGVTSLKINEKMFEEFLQYTYKKELSIQGNDIKFSDSKTERLRNIIEENDIPERKIKE